MRIGAFSDFNPTRQTLKGRQQRIEFDEMFHPFPAISCDDDFQPLYSEVDLEYTRESVLHDVLEPCVSTFSELLFTKKIQLSQVQLDYFRDLRAEVRTLMIIFIDGDLSTQANRSDTINRINEAFVRFDFFSTNMLNRAQRNILADHEGFTQWHQDIPNLRQAHASRIKLE